MSRDSVPAGQARALPPTDFEAMAARYDAGRAVPLESLAGWRDAIRKELWPPPTEPVLDLGSGTGIWAVALAEWFELRVVAVEPSKAMLQEARTKRRHPLVAYIRGEGAHIPIRDRSCAAAWLSAVVHHIADLPACARELRRVLPPGRPVLIRNAFSGRAKDVPMLRFFPGAGEIAARRWPRLEEVTDAFSHAGFGLESITQVPEISARNLTEYVERVRTRADSTLQILSDAEFEQGIDELERTAAESGPEPVIARLDLVVLR